MAKSWKGGEKLKKWGKVGKSGEKVGKWRKVDKSDDFMWLSGFMWIIGFMWLSGFMWLKAAKCGERGRKVGKSKEKW